ncbi:carbohydrate-binding protein [Spirosoma sp. KCTC 42546]|uniref:PQQ-dependent sugar dehydrogenase n=1 Tax=Spirosoma sp. KCTC 42546 TaxID=2520506 RepID=UPI001156D168|nr:PQQ-dependent sugar dehydrogenase [Spirosoma sp. KCTC 42546]QDK78178.1 carbohydrate-binding protein [Spirosoma sp. KCTC 42546]
MMKRHFFSRQSYKAVIPLCIGAIGLLAYSVRPLTDPGDKPDENRFTKVVLAEKLNEPLEMAILPDERVLFIERHGQVQLYSPTTKQVKTIASIPVSTKYKDKEGNETEAEDGLLGVNLDPNFEKNHWVYLYYSPAGNESKNILTRYELRGDELVLSSKKVLLEVATQREQCCHTGGSIDWDREGNLYLSTGDNTSPRATLYAPIDERPGRGPWDAQKSSGNTNDLRGKILRIHPEADGTYTIPEGNLFPKGTPKTRPEIYTMGHRNPYRIAVDKHTGYLYWGDVGPDAGEDSVGVGPTAEDEYNQAKKAGNFGWPYFVGNNKAYYDKDFTTGKGGAKFDPAHPVNDSPNNTGLNDLPPAQPAMIWYPAAESKQFPIMGTGGRSAMAGPTYYKDDFKGAKRPFPEYYNGKTFLFEWMRDMILAVSYDSKGDMTSTERFLPNMAFSHPIDMAFGPNGDLYVLEYGTGWFLKNDDSRLVKIEFNAGNRKPNVQASANQKAGAIPMVVKLSSEGTKDFDGDAITYQWKIYNRTGGSKAGGQPTVLNEPNPTFTFQKPGQYKAILTVTDAHGLKDSREVDIMAGNQPPSVALDILNGNKNFYFPGQPIAYQVSVTDKEDGSLATGKILAKQVMVKANYQTEGSAQNVSEAERGPAGHKFSEATYLGAGQVLMEKSDCKACHFVDKKSVGPAFIEVAKRYKNDANAVASLSNKIIKGGGGSWGDAIMTAHPQLGQNDASEIVKYILTLSDKKVATPSLPTKGTYTPDKNEKGDLVLQASYKDKGANGLPAQTGEQVLVLRNPLIPLGTSNSQSKGVTLFKMGTQPYPIVIVMGSDTYVQFNKFDLTGVRTMEFAVAVPKAQLMAVGGRIEIHIDSPTGPSLGQTEELLPNESKDPADLFKPSITKVTVTPTTGQHDLYFVFKNEKAGKSPLFVPVTVQLSN